MYIHVVDMYLLSMYVCTLDLCSLPSICTFADVLVVNLRGGGGLIDLYCSLLKLLLPEDSPNRTIIDQSLVPLSKGVCNRILSEYVSDCIEDGSTPGGLLDGMPPQAAPDHLNILTFLLEKVLLVVCTYSVTLCVCACTTSKFLAG